MLQKTRQLKITVVKLQIIHFEYERIQGKTIQLKNIVVQI